MGAYIDASIREWIKRAPEANPGILEQLRRRESNPPRPYLVDWAGEFAGKYLISAVQALRMSDDPELREYVQQFVNEYIATQAPDGYLGPWPKNAAGEHLMTIDAWELWAQNLGIMGLLMWHEESGDQAAYDSAIRAADVVCDVFLDGGHRPLELHCSVMNLSIIQSLGWLYRLTGNERYLRFMHVIEEEWAVSADFFREGLAGTPMYLLPDMGCRWESLVDLQGLTELYRNTGDSDYKQAFVNLWSSIRQYDRHPSGAFSTHECAIGDPYDQVGGIETCCTVAWTAMTADMLRLTADSSAADELELSTWNQALASLHPSGSWCTYHTPLNGHRDPSFQSIAFQARPGTPEINCCSVNGFRALGVLTEWAVMQANDGLVVNFYGPSEASVRLKDGAPVILTQEADYPIGGKVRLRMGLQHASEFSLRLRIPAWSANTQVRWDKESATPKAGEYYVITRKWRDGDSVDLEFDMSPRYWAGELSCKDSAALYRGPILLAADAHYNTAPLDALPAVDLKNLEFRPVPVEPGKRPASFPPMGLWDVQTPNGTLRLCDFASAGVLGTDYKAWLAAGNAGPPPVWLARPVADAVIAAGPVLFQWTAYLRKSEEERSFTLRIARDAEFTDIVQEINDIRDRRFVLQPGLTEAGPYYWEIISHNSNGGRKNELGPSLFHVDSSLENTVLADTTPPPLGEGQTLVASKLDGNGAPWFGKLLEEKKVEPAADRFGHMNSAVQLNGLDSGIYYEAPCYSEEDLSVCAWICPDALDNTRTVFSAWHSAGMFNPLCIFIRDGNLFARTETVGLLDTNGVPVEKGKWIHAAAVKEGEVLSLYINGKLAASRPVRKFINAYQKKVAVGANPNAPGENFAGRIDDFQFLARALAPAEVEALAAEKP